MTHSTKARLTPLVVGALLLALLGSLGLSFTYLALIAIGMVWTYLRRPDGNDLPPTPPEEGRSDAPSGTEDAENRRRLQAVPRKTSIG